jgi:predicted acyl esterase
MRLGLAVGLLLVVAGCLAPVERYYAFDPAPQYKNPGVFPGNYTFGEGSTVLEPGTLKMASAEIVRLRSALNAYPEPLGSLLSDGEVAIVMAVWKPQNVTGPIPVIVDAGPYYEIGEHCAVPNQNPCQEVVPDTIDHPSQTTPFLLRNYLPKGYAVVQLAVRGTGTAGGCMDLLGRAEQHDLDQAITWLGTQPWSNGHIAMIGASYDGSTPWLVAAKGNPHLKTIVPVSGLPDIYGLMFHNGSAETRGPIMHNLVYWPFGFSDEFPQSPVPPPAETPVPVPGTPPVGYANGRQGYQDLQNLLCPQVVEGSAIAQLSMTLGGRYAEASDYWTQRDHRADVLSNYKGSVFLIHGLQDWNVDPHSAIPFNVALRDAGVEVKEWYGQWGHAFPDSQCAARAPAWVTLPCRLDFAEVLGRWFDRHLKGLDVDTGPSIQVQDNVGFWRNADSYPPAMPQWLELRLSADGALAPEATAEATVTLDPPRGGPTRILEFKSQPLEEDLRFSGMPTLGLPFAPKASGGMMAAWLMDENQNGRLRAPFVSPSNQFDSEWRPVGVPVIGHAQMNLLYHDGGETRQTLTPGERRLAKMQFEPLEVLVPKGHRLVLWVFQYEYPDRDRGRTPSPVDVFLGNDAVLRLPTIEVDPTTVFPVPGIHFPDRSLADRMHVEPLGFPNGLLRLRGV